MYGAFIGRKKELEGWIDYLKVLHDIYTIKDSAGLAKYQAVSSVNHGNILALSLIGTQRVDEVIPILYPRILRIW